MTSDALRSLIRRIPDFPKKGINFYDLTTLLRDANGFNQTIGHFVTAFEDTKPDYVVGVEARGFMIAPVIAYKLQAGFVPVRKLGKLPGGTLRASYTLEYAEDSLEIHDDALPAGSRVLVIDDVLATGGTLAATCSLIEQLKCDVVGIGVIVELSFLNGRDKLAPRDLTALLKYES